MKTTIILLTLLFAIPHAGAEILAQYDFNSVGTPYADVIGASGLSAGNITPGDKMKDGDGITTNYSSEGAGSYYVAGTNASAGDNSTSAAWVLAKNDGLYFEFTLTPDVGQTLNLTSLQLDVAYKGTDAFRLGVTSSLTGYDYADRLDITTEITADANSIEDVLQSNLGGISVAALELDSDWGAGEGTLIDLSSATFENISSAVTFRIYGFQLNNTSGSNTLFFDDIQVNGAVIPEPTSLVLLLGSIALLLTLARRK